MRIARFIGGLMTGLIALVLAVAFGSAAVCLPGTEVPTPEDVARIDVRVSDPVDLTLSL